MTLPSSVINLLDDGRITIVGLIRFDFGSGTYGFCKASTPLTWSGLTYNPGSIISVSDLFSSTGTTAQQFTIELASSPEDGLTPEILQTIESEDYRDRPVTIYDAYLHPDTGALLHVEALRGATSISFGTRKMTRDTVWWPTAKREHWTTPDPISASGTRLTRNGAIPATSSILMLRPPGDRNTGGVARRTIGSSHESRSRLGAAP